jgi:Domain of unknown function (DUF4159)
MVSRPNSSRYHDVVMRRRSVLVVAVALLVAATADAQFRRGLFGARLATPNDFDGRFHFCRLVYQPSPTGTGGSWTTDYPRADINMSIRLSELTRTNVSFTAGQPNHLLVRPTDDMLFHCPFVIMAAPGSAYFSGKDAERLREYVLKGGFLWADDFWGTYQWDQWVTQIQKVLPPERYPIVDVPLGHPMLRAQFDVTAIPQIPNIGYFMRSGGDTSEQGRDSAVPHARMIADETGRIMVLMTHNTDISDSWEREGDDPTYFYTFGPRGYAFGINALLYAMTH